MRATFEKTVPEFNNIRGRFKMTYYYSCADCHCEVKYYKILPDKIEPRCATCRANRKKAARIALRQAEDEKLKRKAVKEFAKWVTENVGVNCTECISADGVCANTKALCYEALVMEYEKESEKYDK